VRLSEPRRLDSVRNSIAQLVRAHLDGAPLLWREVLAGRCPIA